MKIIEGLYVIAQWHTSDNWRWVNWRCKLGWKEGWLATKCAAQLQHSQREREK
jgi:hypothetical protein